MEKDQERCRAPAIVPLGLLILCCKGESKLKGSFHVFVIPMFDLELLVVAEGLCCHCGRTEKIYTHTHLQTSQPALNFRSTTNELGKLLREEDERDPETNR